MSKVFFGNDICWEIMFRTHRLICCVFLGFHLHDMLPGGFYKIYGSVIHYNCSFTLLQCLIESWM